MIFIVLRNFVIPDEAILPLTHWGQVTHICVIKLTIIIWTNAGILLIRPLGTNFSEILIEIHTFSFKKMHLKLSSAKWHLFCLSLDVLKLAMIQCINRLQFSNTTQSQSYFIFILRTITKRSLDAIVNRNFLMKDAKQGLWCKFNKMGQLNGPWK